MTDYAFLNASLNDTEGGYLVPVGYSNKIINNIQQMDQSLSLLKPWPMTTLVENVPLMSTAASASYTSAEGEAKGATQPAFTQLTLTAQELAAVVVVTERLLMSTNIAGLMGVIQDDLAKAFARAKVQTLFGYANDGTFTNDLTDDAVSSVAYGANGDLMADMSELLSALETLGYFENLAWVTHPAVRRKFRDLRDDNGALILQPGTANAPEMLYGYPIKYSTYFSKVGSPAAYEMFLCDWSKIVEGQMQELRMAKSREATITLSDDSTVNLFQKNMVAIKAWLYHSFGAADLNAVGKLTGL